MTLPRGPRLPTIGRRFPSPAGAAMMGTREAAMLFMVIERFEGNDMVPVYRLAREKGRQLPDGLEYLDSWVAADFSRCFQLMRCDDPVLLQQWVLAWRGAGVAFEIVPVVPSAETRAAAEPHL